MVIEKELTFENILNQDNLSFEAKGLLCHIVNKGKYYVIDVDSLRKEGHFKGKTRVQKILKELVFFGFLEKKALRDHVTGRMIGTRYILL